MERVGGSRTLKLDFRVIAATNRDLKSMLGRQEFRQDLYYRLNIFLLRTPSLRQIRDDIPRLAYHILSSLKETQRQVPARIDASAMKCLVSYDWPGNVRELRNILERASTVANDGVITEKDLPPEVRDGIRSQAIAEGELGTLKDEISRAERRAIERALSSAQGNKTEAARILGIHRTGLYQKMKRYGNDS